MQTKLGSAITLHHSRPLHSIRSKNDQRWGIRQEMVQLAQHGNTPAALYTSILSLYNSFGKVLIVLRVLFCLLQSVCFHIPLGFHWEKAS